MAEVAVARPARRPLASRVSSGHVIMVLAGLLGVLLTVRVLAAADDTAPVLVAAADLAPGTAIDAGALRVARVAADDAVLASLFGGDERAALEGRVVTAAVVAGTLLTRSQVAAPGDGSASRTMSFALPRPQALDAALVRGDLVDVVAVEPRTGRSGYVMTGAEVLAADSGAGGPLGGARDVTVTLAVDAGSALALAGALETASVTLVRATGAAPIDAAQPFVTAPDRADTRMADR